MEALLLKKCPLLEESLQLERSSFKGDQNFKERKMKKLTLFAMAAIAAGICSPALATMDGLSVSADIAFGPNGEYRESDPSGPYWGTSKIVGQDSIWVHKQSSYYGKSKYTAEVGDSLLTLTGDIDFIYGAYLNGFEMRFSTPLGFGSFALKSAQFLPDLTYKLDQGVIVVDWLGGPSATGKQTFSAVFGISSVPEPNTAALLLVGMVGVMAARAWPRHTADFMHPKA